LKGKILVAVICILLYAACAIVASKHHETQKAASAHHHDSARHNCAACHTLSRAEAESLLDRFGTVKDVRPAPVKGLYEVILQQGNRRMAVYVDFGKKHILAGRIYAIGTHKVTSPQPVAATVK
jgi:hypothetical protein